MAQAQLDQARSSRPEASVGLDITVRSGSGTGRTLLSAFDNALQGAGVADFNLVTLSSVIPTGQPDPQRRTASLPGGHGDLLFCVRAQAFAERPGDEAWAGLGLVRRRDRRRTVRRAPRRERGLGRRTDRAQPRRHECQARRRLRPGAHGPGFGAVAPGCPCARSSWRPTGSRRGTTPPSPHPSRSRHASPDGLHGVLEPKPRSEAHPQRPQARSTDPGRGALASEPLGELPLEPRRQDPGPVGLRPDHRREGDRLRHRAALLRPLLRDLR